SPIEKGRILHVSKTSLTQRRGGILNDATQNMDISQPNENGGEDANWLSPP
ncbi:hypothetical protein TorRG33x02_257330, partial [Trema orientale]